MSIRGQTLRVRGKGAGLYPLANTPQGMLGVRLELGARFGLCAAAPAKSPATEFDTAARFVGARDTPAPSMCPPVP